MELQLSSAQVLLMCKTLVSYSCLGTPLLTFHLEVIDFVELLQENLYFTYMELLESPSPQSFTSEWGLLCLPSMTDIFKSCLRICP